MSRESFEKIGKVLGELVSQGRWQEWLQTLPLYCDAAEEAGEDDEAFIGRQVETTLNPVVFPPMTWILLGSNSDWHGDYPWRELDFLCMGIPAGQLYISSGIHPVRLVCDPGNVVNDERLIDRPTFAQMLRESIAHYPAEQTAKGKP